MTRYWVIRTDKGKTDYIWSELAAGRLRQGWGWSDDQDLRRLARQRMGGEPMADHQLNSWRGNRRLLCTEPDAVQQGDVLVLPHLPRHGVWSLARVSGDYRWEPPTEINTHGFADYGHVLPVQLITTADRPIDPYEEHVAAGLRQTMRNLSRMWSIDALGGEVESLIQLVESGAASVPAPTNRLPYVLTSAQSAAWEEIARQFHGSEFERPCILLLESLYGEGNVEHTGGSGERGADAICTFTDPLGLVHRLAVQIKMWGGDADLLRPLEQIRQAHEAYDGITGGVILSTAERVTERFEAQRAQLESELRIPVLVILRDELVSLFLANLPRLAAATS